jgi:PPOX class probable F420-dependent enzyme
MASHTPARLSEDQVALLKEKVLAHVATVMPDGSPHVTPVWVDTDGEAVLFNTAKGRIKHRNLSRDPRIAISLTDKQDDYRTVVIRGRAEIVEEGADTHIDRLAKKYLGADTYPFRKEGEERVIIRIVPEQILGR